MRLIIMAIIAALAAFPAMALEQDASPPPDAQPAEMAATPFMPDFPRHVLSLNAFGLASAKLALQQSQSDRVKRYAQTMMYTYTKSKGQLVGMMRVHSEPLPEPIAMESDERRQFALLKATKKRDFNQVYMAMQVTLHRNETMLFKFYLRHGSSSTLKHFARQALPVSQQALQQAKNIRSK